ncbi:hypothetical protein ACVINZ_000842 [Mesorhizobium jarvisii]
MAARAIAGHTAGDRGQPSVRHWRRHCRAVAGGAVGAAVPGDDPQGSAQDPRDGALFAADRLFRDQGSAEEQHGRASRGGAAAEGGCHHRGIPRRWRRHRAERLWPGARPAMEDVPGASGAGCQGIRHSDAFFRTEWQAVPFGQRADEHGRARWPRGQIRRQGFADAAAFDAHPRIRAAFRQGDRRARRRCAELERVGAAARSQRHCSSGFTAVCSTWRRKCRAAGFRSCRRGRNWPPKASPRLLRGPWPRLRMPEPRFPGSARPRP